jgi:hypothetical protein
MPDPVTPVDANGNPIVEVPPVVVPPVAPEKPKAPTYDEAQQAHINGVINEAYGKAFDKATGIYGPQIKELNDKLAALAAKVPSSNPSSKYRPSWSRSQSPSPTKSHG